MTNAMTGEKLACLVDQNDFAMCEPSEAKDEDYWPAYFAGLRNSIAGIRRSLAAINRTVSAVEVSGNGQ